MYTANSGMVSEPQGHPCLLLHVRTQCQQMRLQPLLANVLLTTRVWNTHYLVKSDSRYVCDSFCIFNLDSADLGHCSPQCAWASSGLLGKAGNLLSLSCL